MSDALVVPSPREVQNLQTTVTGIQGRPVSAQAPAYGNVMSWDGTQWIPGLISSNQISGVTDGSNASPGFVGEYIELNGTVSSDAFPEGTLVDLSPQLPAGDWDCYPSVIGGSSAGFLQSVNLWVEGPTADSPPGGGQVGIVWDWSGGGGTAFTVNAGNLWNLQYMRWSSNVASTWRIFVGFTLLGGSPTVTLAAKVRARRAR